MRERINSRFTPWKVGDKVWLEAKDLHIKFQNRKLSPKRVGPFEISQVLSRLNYRLKLPQTWKIHDVFHASKLSSAVSTKEHGPSFPNPPPQLVQGEQEYEIEKILRHKGTGRNRRYLIAWKGYSETESTWEPETNLTHAQKELKSYKKIHRL